MKTSSDNAYPDRELEKLIQQQREDTSRWQNGENHSPNPNVDPNELKGNTTAPAVDRNAETTVESGPPIMAHVYTGDQQFLEGSEVLLSDGVFNVTGSILLDAEDGFLVEWATGRKSIEKKANFELIVDVTSLQKAASEDSFVPPTSVANAAKRGLELRREHNRGGTEVGVARARDLSNRKGLSYKTVKRMKAYFDRHEVDKKGEGWGKDSAGYIAWLLWGGDSGRSWANKIIKQKEKKKESSAIQSKQDDWFDPSNFDSSHNSPFDRGSADFYYGRQFEPHYYAVGEDKKTQKVPVAKDTPEWRAYEAGYVWARANDLVKDWGED